MPDELFRLRGMIVQAAGALDMLDPRDCQLTDQEYASLWSATWEMLAGERDRIEAEPPFEDGRPVPPRTRLTPKNPAQTARKAAQRMVS